MFSRAFAKAPALRLIAHHNATLTNISSFGPRVTATASEDIRF
jgi:hypothetical protein